MAYEARRIESETESLLPHDQNEQHESTQATSVVRSNQPYLVPYLVLPIAFLAALAMSSTAATAYYTYATLLCKDARHCDGEEASRYAKFIATAVSISNILGLIALGPLQRISRNHQKLGLLLWLLTRSTSPVMLLLGAKTRNIYVALSGRIIDGFASDNLLHFTLNTIYAQSPETSITSSLIGYSLALYMVGISVSPFVAGLFQNFTVSFSMAIGFFALAVAYLQLCVTPRKHKNCETVRESDRREDLRNLPNSAPESVHGILKTLIAPLRIFNEHFASLLCGLGLLTYNLVQSYTFGALLVHTSLRFGFAGKENGFLITIAHSVAAMYLAISLCIIPQVLMPFLGRAKPQQSAEYEHRTKDGFLAIVSLGIQSVSLLVIGLATKTWHIYVATVLLALGLPTPSFIKAYVVGHFEGLQRNEALAALAVMEVVGDVLGPIVFGGWQSYNTGGALVFFGAAGMVATSAILLTGGMLVTSRSTGFWSV